MTPTAVTPAARRARPQRRSAGPERAAIRRPPVVTAVRRGAARVVTRRRAGRRRSPRRRVKRRTHGARARPARAARRRTHGRPSARRSGHRRLARQRIARRSAPRATPRARRRVVRSAGRRRQLDGRRRLRHGRAPGADASPPAPRAAPRRASRLPRSAPRLPRVEPPSPAALARGAAAFVASLPESSLLDRVIRGRIWIPLLGVLLVGIVGMQVENLKLNAGLGGAIEQTTTLQSRNDWLRDDVAQLSDPQRIEGIAARHGMLMAPPSATKFLARPGAIRGLGARGDRRRSTLPDRPISPVRPGPCRPHGRGRGAADPSTAPAPAG